MDKFGHQMTRIVPFGGEFLTDQTVSLQADARIENEGSLHYTLDGSEPNLQSPTYTDAITLQASCIIKARSFDANGHPIGFMNEAEFKKVEQLEYPSWYSSLLAGKYTGNSAKATSQALALEIHGALMVNISDDPDLIDASGGYNFGCFIKSIDRSKGKMWLDAELETAWIIQAVEGEKVQHINDFQALLKKYQGQEVTITAVRNYNSKQCKVQFP